jgi:hypothetical protein
MKTRLYIILLAVLSLIFAACKDDSTTEPDPPGDTGNYFPGGIGTYYKFDLERQDSTGTTIQGQRSTTYGAMVNLNNTSYMTQTDTLFIQGIATPSETYFRKTDTGVFYFVDTTGLAGIFDTLLQYVSFDKEIRAFEFPLPDAGDWPVFKLNLTISILVLNIINVQAFIDSKENITINLTSGDITREAVKVRYVLTLDIRDLGNPLQQNLRTYNAYCWVVKDIGVARWEGNAAILGVFTGTGIDLGDSTSTVSQNLIEYSIK